MECALAETTHGWIPISPEENSEKLEERCPRLAAPLEPQNASVFAPMTTEIRIRMTVLPTPTDESMYQCLFGEKHFVLAQFEAPNTLVCNFPPFLQNDGPKIPINQGGTFSSYV